MAGESPDKSEQRKSSGETTPGERDPRLAVFRQASPGATGPRVDEPTAVFKTVPRETASETSGSPGGLGASGTPGTPEPGTASGSVENDARLRAAVAAWVASADDDGEPGGEGAGASTGASPAGRADEGADGAAVRCDGHVADAVDAPAGDRAVRSGAVALPAGQDEAEGRRGDAPADRAGGEDADGTAVRRDGSGDGQGADPADRTPAAGKATRWGAAASAAEKVDDGAGSAVGTAEAEGDASVEVTTSDETPTAPPADGTEGPATAKGDADADAPASARDEAANASRSGSAADTTDAGESAKSAESAEAKDRVTSATPKRGVDQPTAVFKALRRPPVDQPTTALKIPPMPKPKPEAGAERPSTFVPLWRDDAWAPGARRPGAAPPARQPLPPASLTEPERTRQQPMPPLPPLDLLAELTNTPPPPQTPVRTVMRRIKIWTPLVLLLLIIFAVVQVVRPLPDTALALSATPTYTFKGGQLSLPWPGEGQGAAEVEGVGSLGTYGPQKPAPIASVAKTMTAYVILKEHPITGKEVGPKITVDKKAEDESKLPDESTAPIREGQQFTEKQMLQLLMIPSGNNAARLLARWDAKSKDAFVRKMNDAAKDLGMTDTTYTDPSGLDATTVSTPQDQLKLAKAVMQNDVFREIVNTTLITIPGVDGQIRNNNDKALLKDGVGGIKTGSSSPAGGNLLWSANTVVDGEVRRIVGIVMGIQNADTLDQKLTKAIDHSIELIEAAQDGVTSATVIKKGEVVGYVDDGFGGQTPLVATKDLKTVGWAGLTIDIELTGGGKAIPHSGKAGRVVGQVSVGSGTGKVTVPVALQRDLVEPGFGDKLTRLG